MPDEFYNLAQKKVGNKTEPNWGIKLKLDNYSFDYEHRLKSYQQSAFSGQYFYDGKGNRLKATRNGETTYYIHDMNNNVLAEADGNKNITKIYVHGQGLIGMVTPTDQVYSYHFNAIGSTVAITDQTQIVVNAYAYDSFGRVLNQTETIPQPFKYVGQYGVMHEPNGFYYMRARYYDPSVGRFISEDPIGFEGGTVNLYEYVGNNPVNSIDPFGLAILVCNRKTDVGIGNHAYFWDDRTPHKCCGMGSTKSCTEKGPIGGDQCRKVTGSDGKEDKLLKCCKDTSDKGIWFPPMNDCHEALDDCLKDCGLKTPGAPGGRLGKPCEPCPK